MYVWMHFEDLIKKNASVANIIVHLYYVIYSRLHWYIPCPQ